MVIVSKTHILSALKRSKKILIIYFIEYMFFIDKRHKTYTINIEKKKIGEEHG